MLMLIMNPWFSRVIFQEGIETPTRHSGCVPGGFRRRWGCHLNRQRWSVMSISQRKPLMRAWKTAGALVSQKKHHKALKIPRGVLKSVYHSFPSYFDEVIGILKIELGEESIRGKGYLFLMISFQALSPKLERRVWRVDLFSFPQRRSLHWWEKRRGKSNLHLVTCGCFFPWLPFLNERGYTGD